MMAKAEITKADLNDPVHAQAILDLLDAYSMDNMGQSAPMADEIKSKLIEGLKEHPTSLILLATVGHKMAGLAVCFFGFSTFYAKKLINIHDLVVLPEFRGMGVGRQLMQAVEAAGRETNCCKVTLEVRDDNLVAQTLYRQEGYGDSKPPMYFWSKFL